MKHSDFYEKKQHGSPNFPLEYYFVDQNHKNYVMPAHYHKEFEIIRVLEGEFSVFLNNTEYVLSKGNVIFIECGCLHHGIPNDCVYECLVFNLNMLINPYNVTSKYISPVLHNEVGVNCFACKSNSGIYATVNSLFSAAREKREFYELDILSLLFKLFSHLYSENNIVSCGKTLHSHQAQTVSKIIDYIDKNFSENISLKTLANIGGLNEKYLCRIFKEYTAKTVVTYINELRIEKAGHEILKKGKSITQAAFDSGFNDLSYFSKTFKKYKGISPNEYIKTRTL